MSDLFYFLLGAAFGLAVHIFLALVKTAEMLIEKKQKEILK